MNRYNLALVAVSLAVGLLLGCLLTLGAIRRHWMRMPVEAAIRKMDRVLKLSPEQHKQVESAVKETRDQVVQLHRDCRRQRWQLLGQGRERIRALLTPAQQADFDRYFALPKRAREGVP